MAQSAPPSVRRRRRRWPYVLGAVVALLAIAVVIAVRRLDTFLLEQARARASEASAQLGRPVELGGLSTQLWPRLGVVVRDVSVGAAPGEEAPLATLDRAEVNVELLPLWRSR